jgi:hypothetical protein
VADSTAVINKSMKTLKLGSLTTVLLRQGLGRSLNTFNHKE